MQRGNAAAGGERDRLRLRRARPRGSWRSRLDAAIINAVALGVGLVVAVGLSLFHLPHDVEVVLVAVGGGCGDRVGHRLLHVLLVDHGPDTRATGCCRSRCARENGERLHLGRAFLRVLALPLSVIPFGAGMVLILFDRRRRALHDLLVGTVVVYVVRGAGGAPQARYSTSPPPSSATRRPKRISAG